MVNVDLYLYHYIHDAFYAIPHMLLEQDMTNPERARLKYKMFFPILYWWYTFGGKQICVKKKSEKIKIETSVRKKMREYKTSYKFCKIRECNLRVLVQTYSINGRV